MQVLLEQLKSGDFSALRGARVDVTLPIPQSLLLAGAQDATSRGGPARVTDLQVHAGNQIEMHLQVEKWGFKHALATTIEIERDLGFPHAPRLRLALPPSQAWLGGVLQVLVVPLGLLPGGLSISGRHIEIDLRAGAPDDRARAILHLIKHAEIDSQEGRLILNARLEVD